MKYYRSIEIPAGQCRPPQQRDQVHKPVGNEIGYLTLELPDPLTYAKAQWKKDEGSLVPPRRCVVVEDSEVGLRAAAAGMHALHHVPDSLRTGRELGNCFRDMAQLPQLIEELSQAF